MFGLGKREREMPKSYEDEEFGEVTVIVNPRATRMNVRIRPEGLRATLPVGMDVESLKRFIDANHDEIRRRMVSVRSRSVMVIDEAHPLRTLTFETLFVADEILKVFRFQLQDGVLTISYPQGVSLEAVEPQQLIKKGVEHFLRQEAKRVLPPRVRELATKWGFEYADVKIQSSNSRWGSCSVRKGGEHHINLSMYLLLVKEQELVDSVILHELCHTVEMNHGPKFWALMERVTAGKAHALKRALNAYRCGL